MTRRSVTDLDAGRSVMEATAEGVHAALFYGGVISAVAVLVALPVRGPNQPAAAPAAAARVPAA